jgi:hypothetical protein
MSDLASTSSGRAYSLLTPAAQALSEKLVAHRDRLARIGYGLLEHVFLRAGSVLTIVEDNACDGCPEELHEDVMAVLTHFTAKHNGKRSYVNRKVARSLKIRILPNAEKSFSSSTLGRRDTFTTKRRHWLKVCPTELEPQLSLVGRLSMTGPARRDRGVQQDEV